MRTRLGNVHAKYGADRTVNGRVIQVSEKRTVQLPVTHLTMSPLFQNGRAGLKFFWVKFPLDETPNPKFRGESPGGFCVGALQSP